MFWELKNLLEFIGAFTLKPTEVILQSRIWFKIHPNNFKSLIQHMANAIICFSLNSTFTILYQV